MSAREFSKAEIIDQLHALGVERGGILLVHTSYRAVRPVEGGPRGLIDALHDAVGPTGTLTMPSFGNSDDVLFDPKTTPTWDGLGAVAEVFWRRPGVLRSDHCQAFAAMGPHARDILRDPLPLPPHKPESPAGRVHDLDGQVLLLGAGHDANTMLHLAELIAGVPYGVPRYCMAAQDGRAVRVDYEENDHCCERFALADAWLRNVGLQSEGRVGHAHARLARARDIVRVAVQELRRDPLIFLHTPEDACADCDEARASAANAASAPHR